MPAKSRNTRGKHPHQSRKSKAKLRQGLTAAKPETPTRAAQVVEKIKLSETRPTAPAPKAQAMVYPYVTEELKRIGILAAFIIVILVVLAIVIP